MALNIAVCLKVVPDPEQYDKIQLDPVRKTLVREGIDSVISSTDLHAVELALQLKSKFGGRITLLSMGPGSNEKLLREGLSYGCDEAYLLSDRKLGGADALATSYSLVKGLEKAGVFDLILLGNASDDGATALVPSQMGEMFGIAHMTDVIGFEMEEEGQALVKKEMSDGVYTYKVALPAVFGVTKRLNTVRHPSVMGIFQAKNKPLTVLTAADLDDLDESRIGLEGSYTQSGDYRNVDYHRECVELEGSDAEKAAEILKTVSKLIRR